MNKLFLIVGLALSGLAGCNRNPGAVAQIPVAQVPATLNNAFGKAAPELKGMADEAVSAVQSKDAPKAFLDLRDLCARPDLTPEQRSVAAGAMVAMSKELRTAAENGDKNAADFLRSYMSTR